MRSPSELGAVVVLRHAEDRVDDSELWDGAVHLWLVRGRWRRIARRGISATILARYAGVEPNELEFTRSDDGKPELLTDGLAGPIHFSTSVAPGLFALAVAAAPVGVDVELRARRVSSDALIGAVCTERERTALASLEPSQRHERFIWCWTGKEACAKASGIGLGAPFDEIDAGLGEVTGPLAVEATADDRHGPWTLHRIAAAPDYAVAIAVL